jgi:hypothetical protein
MDVCQTIMACLYQGGAGLSSTVRVRKGEGAWSRGAYLLTVIRRDAAARRGALGGFTMRIDLGFSRWTLRSTGPETWSELPAHRRQPSQQRRSIRCITHSSQETIIST